MELNGKKLAFLGDSITAGVGTPPPYERVFWRVLAERTGAVCQGDGQGGTRIAATPVPNPNQITDTWYFLTRVDNLDADADAVVVFGGTNDFGMAEVPLGSFDDRTLYTFYGALHLLCLKLLERFPTKTVVFISPLHRVDEDNCEAQHRPTDRVPHRLADYRRAIFEVMEYYAIPVLDLYAVSGIQPRVSVIRERLMPDGVHPNEAGYARLADRVEGFLRSL
ncbi:MAG: SGNH/GDSL hydrolase family protein [Clostridia bacterium]|nr:SGNH/GDSL hydrolase family protein [Clostridia bacterium]